MTNADQLLEHCTEEIDKAICDFGVQMAQQLLDAGVRVDDLRPLMQPFIRKLAQRRADAIAEMHARVRPIRLIEARIALNQGLIARIEACMACLERLEATVH
jgi:hypothetical protein